MYMPVRRDISKNASPVRIPWNSDEELKDACIRKLVSDRELADYFRDKAAGGGRSASEAEVLLRNVLRAGWNPVSKFDSFEVVAEFSGWSSVYGEGPDRSSMEMADRMSRLVAAEGNHQVRFSAEDMVYLAKRMEVILGVADYQQMDWLQKVSWKGREYLLPGHESLSITAAADVNGKTCFLAFENDGMYGNAVIDENGRHVLDFGPYGPPSLITVGPELSVFVQHQDAMSGVGMSSPLVFYDEDGNELFMARPGSVSVSDGFIEYSPAGESGERKTRIGVAELKKRMAAVKKELKTGRKEKKGLGI